jgi:very-short-patch-repair endonuclease
MAKFITNVAGVTFYKIDFESISDRSKVQLVPNPNNPHDENAIKVIINGKQVGHIKKELNSTLCKEIQHGSKVSARVRAVVGGGPGKHYGIILDVIVDDGYTSSRTSNNLGNIVKQSPNEIKVVRGKLPDFEKIYSKDLWIDFLEKKKNLPLAIEIPQQPDYHEEYKKNVPWLSKLLKDSFENYARGLYNEWLKKYNSCLDYNNNRQIMLNNFNQKKEIFSQEFSFYCDETKIKSLFEYAKMFALKNSNIEASPYNTVYERLIYDALKKKVINTYNQVAIYGNSIDILCIPQGVSAVWAIEIDGGIHNYQAKVDRDLDVEKCLIKLGISLIRIPNFLISKSVENTVDKIFEIMGIEGTL